jgi:nucleotide-binding universal stress UspA family protein
VGPPGFEQIVITRPDPDERLTELNHFVEPEVAPGVSMETLVRDGDAAGEILGQAADMNADLLVLGTHGRSGFARLLLGSVTEKVLRKATCAVLTVPQRHPDAVPASPVIFTRILCPVDFSDCSMRALAYAMSLAQEADAQLTVLHVLAHELESLQDMYDFPVVDDHMSLADYRRRCAELAEHRLREAVPDAVAAYCHVKTVTMPGKPGCEILRVADEQQIDLIVLGVQGRGRADVLLFGSTTNHVVRQAVCPVLTLKGPMSA